MKATGNSGLQPALDWLEAHGENEAAFQDNEPETKTAKTCLKCNSCNKKFMKLEQAELHAARTLHEDFEEAAYEETELEAEAESEPIKVLTEEEKTARLEELRAKLAVKRAAREKELKETEVLRKTSSRELEQIRRDMQAKEMKRLAEERRQEKVADRKRREEIKRQIEEDRANKKAQIEAEKAKAMGVNQDIIMTSSAVVDSIESTSNCASTCARIQIKLPPPNPPMKLTFSSPSTETFKDLKLRIQAESSGSVRSVGELIQTFPTRVFSKEDDDKTLNELGLAPSATLILK